MKTHRQGNIPVTAPDWPIGALVTCTGCGWQGQIEARDLAEDNPAIPRPTVILTPGAAFSGAMVFCETCEGRIFMPWPDTATRDRINHQDRYVEPKLTEVGPARIVPDTYPEESWEAIETPKAQPRRSTNQRIAEVNADPVVIRRVLRGEDNPDESGDTLGMKRID